MEKTMVGLVKTRFGEGNMELREVPEPRPGRGQVLIAVAATGICGSDLHIYHSDIDLAMRFPVITGHEFSGTIVALGDEVGLEIGQRVSGITSYETCGACLNCKTGKTNICQRKKLIGYWYDGAFANYIVIPAHNVQVLPDEIMPTLTFYPTYTPFPTLESAVAWKIVTATKDTDILKADKKDGFYLVGEDIATGTWRILDDQSYTKCYWKLTDRSNQIVRNYIGVAGGAFTIDDSILQLEIHNCGVAQYVGE